MAKGRILAVDDQRYFRELITGLLAREGFDVRTAGSGEEALQTLERERFDIVVTDLVMPGMSGSDLVSRIKARDPEQDVVVVTGVVDVRSAVDAMKVGASEYLLKPFDREALSKSLEAILQRRRLRTERDRLLAENIEYMADRSLFERSVALFATLSLEALSEKILDAFARELDAEGGVLWLASDTDDDRLLLAAVHGLVRGSEEPESLSREDLPIPLRDAGAVCCVGSSEDPEQAARPALWILLRASGRPDALIRLTDKRGGVPFDEVDRGCAERLSRFAEIALRNARHVRGIERRALQDPATGVHRLELLHDVLQREIERAARFGRAFSVARLRLLTEWRDPADSRDACEALVTSLRTRLRAADLLALAEDSSILVLLADTDALGAATFKRRVREWMRTSDSLRVGIGVASCPSDAGDWHSLERALDARLERDAGASAWEQTVAMRGVAAALTELLDEGSHESVETAMSLARLVLAEVGRHPRERNLFFFHPGAAFSTALSGFDARRAAESSTEVVVLAAAPARPPAEGRVSWVGPEQLPGCPPFAIHYGDGPPYALICSDKPGPEGMRLFHTNDRETVEALAFQLQRELRLPTLA
jgi:DNA-binding response OmpR family regulator